MANVNVLNFMSNVSGDSWLHRLDPRTKIAILLFFSTLPLLFSNPLYVLGFIILTVPLWLTARLDIRSMLAPLLASGVFLVMIFLISMFRGVGQGAEMDAFNPASRAVAETASPGAVADQGVKIDPFNPESRRLATEAAVQATTEAAAAAPATIAPVTPSATAEPSAPTPTEAASTGGWRVQLGPLTITSGTMTRAGYVSGRLVVPLTIGLLMISTTDPTLMAKGMRKLRMPIDIVFMALAGLRFIPIVMEQIFSILDAQTIRGVGRSAWQRVKLLVMPLFISSLRRTRTMGLACEAKAFGAHKWNDFLDEFKLKAMDKVMLFALAVIAVVVLVARYGYGLGAEYRVGF